MNSKSLINVFRSISEIDGFVSKRNLFWRNYGELTALVQVQDSRWGQGKYVNLGCMPTQMITKPVPPTSTYWGISHRAESIESPFRESFSRLALDSDGTLPPENMIEPLKWVVKWLKINVENPDVLRNSVVQRMSTDFAPVYSPDWMFADWAAGKLKLPQEYFSSVTSYYG